MAVCATLSAVVWAVSSGMGMRRGKSVVDSGESSVATFARAFPQLRSLPCRMDSTRQRA